MSDPPTEAVDWSRFHAVAADCDWSAGELMSFYADGTRKQLDEIEAALAAGDAGEVRRLTHGARGSSETCGVSGMSELFRQLEERAAEERMAGGHQLVERSRRRLETIVRVLEELGG